MKKILGLLFALLFIIVVASCGSKTYTITFDSNGGSNVAAMETDKSGKIEKPEDPTKSGFTFNGWYLSKDATGDSYDFNQAFTKDTTLYAGWVASNTYTVTFNTNGGSTINNATTSNDGKITKPEDPIKDYYTFAGWYSDSDLTKEFSFDTVLTENITLYAKWTLMEVMSYKNFMASESGDSVVIEGYIADRQSWWSNKATMYLVGDNQGEGYFIYEMAMTEEEYNTKYTIGTKLRVYGLKTIYAGEHEIMGDNIDYNLTSVVEDAKMPNHVVDVTYSVATEDLEDLNNAYFTATLKIKEYPAQAENSETTVSANKAYAYKGDEPTDDLYFVLEDANGNELSCCVEYYLVDYYDTLKQVITSSEFTIGKLVKVTGYMYWWNGANPHITSISFEDDAMYETFMSTPDGENVNVSGYLVAKTTYYNGTTNLYLTSKDGSEGYYVYNYECTQEQFNALVYNSTNPIEVAVSGVKASYAGMQEIIDATVTITGNSYKIDSIQFTDLSNLNENFMCSIFVTTLTVKEYPAQAENSGTTVSANKAYAYKGDEPTDDLYFILVDANGNELSCCVEAYIDYSQYTPTFKDGLYNAVKSLQVGDVVSVSGFMYWWNGANPHIISISVND